MFYIILLYNNYYYYCLDYADLILHYLIVLDGIYNERKFFTLIIHFQVVCYILFEFPLQFDHYNYVIIVIIKLVI